MALIYTTKVQEISDPLAWDCFINVSGFHSKRYICTSPCALAEGLMWFWKIKKILWKLNCLSGISDCQDADN